MTKQLSDSQMVEVWNNGTGTVFYKVDDKPKRVWDLPDSMKKIALGELRALVNMAGGFVLLAEELLVKDIAVREDLSLPTTIEMMLGREEIESLLKSDVDALDSALENTNGVIKDKIADIAIKNKITDTEKMEVIQVHTGVDVYNAIKDAKEEAAVKEKNKSNNKGIK